MSTDTPLTDAEWTIRASARLHARWPTISRSQRDEAAAEVAAKPHMRCLEPEDAVAIWLQPIAPSDVPF